MQVKMRIKGLKTNETSFKNAQDENQTEDTGQNLEYDNGDWKRQFNCKKTTI